jgi:outer membrane protein assembly factor BamA
MSTFQVEEQSFGSIGGSLGYAQDAGSDSWTQSAAK